jgi:transposase
VRAFRHGCSRRRHTVPAAPIKETGTVQEEPGPVDKTFRPYRPQPGAAAAALAGRVAENGHMARFVSELVEEVLDLSAIRAAYTEERGYPPYDPRLMVKLLIYGYCTGQRSSRGIEKRCWDDVAFRYLAAGVAPDYRSIARFRRRHLEALAGLFLQTLRLCQQAGMVPPGSWTAQLTRRGMDPAPPHRSKRPAWSASEFRRTLGRTPAARPRWARIRLARTPGPCSGWNGCTTRNRPRSSG